MNSLLFAVAVSISAPGLKDPAKGPELLGRWSATELIINGKNDTQNLGLEYEFTKDGSWIIYRNGQNIGGIARTYKVDSKAKMPTIDLCEAADGSTMPGIFKVSGDEMTLSFNMSKGNRPADFDETANVMKFVFKKVKAKD